MTPLLLGLCRPGVWAAGRPATHAAAHVWDIYPSPACMCGRPAEGAGVFLLPVHCSCPDGGTLHAVL